MLNDPSTPPFIQAGQGGNEKVLQAMNITNKNCIKEFYMFIHGPFATNIYLDIMAEVGAKVLTND
jgi:hypothetical protein